MKNRIEKNISRTAEMTCSLRAASFFETDPGYHSDDYIAPVLLPKWILPVVKSKTARKLAMQFFTPEGIYEYVIARTRYFDEITAKALAGRFEQILILGAGFDTRAVRFGKVSESAVFFELDAWHTQNAKTGQYKKRNIHIPESLVFIPVNFNNEGIRDKLDAYEFDKNKKSLFLLEGLLMYLDENAVIDVFNMITDFSVTGSWVICDFIYKSVLRKEKRYFGEPDIYQRVNKYGEAWKFGIEDDEITGYFQKMGFQVLDIFNSKKLEKKYFSNDSADLINGTHAIAWLEVV